MKIIEPKFWWNDNPSILIKLMSLPFGILLKILIFLRNKLLKKIFLPKPVICVGNFVVGGQGKTPFVRYLRSVLEDVDKKTVVISNGYGGKMKSPKIITEIDKSIDCGDEALLHAKDGITVVSKNRVDAIEVLDKSHFDLILLDDGFQDPSIHKDLNIVIVDTSKGIGNNLLIPFGPMRESLDFALKKTDIVILINSINQNHQSIINVLKIWKGLVLNAEYETYIDEDINEEIIAFSGISNPDKFTYGLKSIGARVNKHFIFSDHENISEDDAKEIFEYSKFKNLRIVTTEKDLIKLKESKKDSYREKLYLSSILAKVRIRFDEAILINFLKEKKLI
jgi:tetraacyldisaccharide 4'-kinase